MLKFDRKIFRSGVIICTEIVTKEDGSQIKIEHIFKIKDKGKNFTFANEEYMLNKYPNLFTLVE